MRVSISFWQGIEKTGEVRRAGMASRVTRSFEHLHAQLRALEESQDREVCLSCVQQAKNRAKEVRKAALHLEERVRKAERHLVEARERSEQAKSIHARLAREEKAAVTGGDVIETLWDACETTNTIQERRETALLRRARRLYLVEEQLARSMLKKEAREMLDLVRRGASSMKMQDTPMDAWLRELRALAAGSAYVRPQSASEDVAILENPRAREKHEEMGASGEKSVTLDVVCVRATLRTQGDGSKEVRFETLRRGMLVLFNIKANPHGDPLKVICPLGLTTACASARDSASRGYGAQQTIKTILWPAIDAWRGQMRTMMDKLGLAGS